jgi:two-component system response regulator NreC
MPNKITLVIADDHPLILNGLIYMLKGERELDIVGEATNGRELIKLVERVRPEIVITDLKMPGMDGFEAVRIIKKISPETGIIVISVFKKEQYFIRMIEAGAFGYLAKEAGKHEILKAIHTVRKNEFYCSSNFSKSFVRKVATSTFNPYTLKPGVNVLTEFEKVIIMRICEGKISKDISEEFGQTVRTIQTYRQAILEKLDLPNSAALIIYAVKKGLYEVGEDY